MPEMWDIVVIGGGSGGLAAAKQAASDGAKVLLFDFVEPSPQGTKWGLGGTCVNVGCIPKKLMHYSSTLGSSFADAEELGWELSEPSNDWGTLVGTVQNQIKMINFRSRSVVRSSQVTYINAKAHFKDQNTVEYELNGELCVAQAKAFIVAVGGRPGIPDIPGSEYGITSDDFFSLDTPPGKTLIVGGGYVALETAGILTGLRGPPPVVCVRTIVLRDFDRQCAEKIQATLAETGTNFLEMFSPTEITRRDDGKLAVTFVGPKGKVHKDTFDTVMFATGRVPNAKKINLEGAGVKLHPDGKVQVNAFMQTNVETIFAIGDIVDKFPELTPVAIQCGISVATNIVSGTPKEVNIDLVPTAVFTPVEYASVGLSEEAAIEKYGAANIEVYLSEFMPVEFQAAHRTKHEDMQEDGDEELSPVCLSKLVCLKNENEKIVGFHTIAPHASETVQGFVLALKLGACKSDLDEMIGIHPTDAESFVGLTVSKSSGESWLSKDGCGGGTCG